MMKLLAKLLSLLGALAGLFYLCHRAIARLYENTIHRYVVFGEPEEKQQEEM